MSTDEIIRHAIPGASPELCEHILWGRTPFPIGSITARSLYKAARSFDRATKNGLQLCDHCHRPARPDGYECEPCHAALTQAAE